MALSIVIILVVVGIVFMILELFFFPGITIAGIASVAAFVAAIYYAYTHLGVAGGNLTLLATVIFGAIAVWLFLRSNTLDKMALKTEIDGKIDPLKNLNIAPGDKGLTASRLAPMGKVKIENHIVEAKTSGEFLDPNTKIVVLEVYTTNILVEREKE